MMGTRTEKFRTRILVEPSDYTLLNSGDMAMLHTAVARLRDLWPDAFIQVLSDTPDLLPQYYPDAEPLDATGRRIWFGNFLHCRQLSALPGFAASWVTKLEPYLRRHHPRLVEIILRFRRKRSGMGSDDLNAFLQAVSEADLVIVSGMGGITDAFLDYAEKLLDTLALAIRHGAVIALMGQGLGPLEERSLLSRARAVLTRVDFIALREDLAGGPLLKALGVHADRVMTTGDDAIEMAYRRRLDQLGHGIGVNLRAATYAEVDTHIVGKVGRLLRDAAERYAAEMVPIPISRVPGEEDALTIRQLMLGHDNHSDAGIGIDHPFKVIEAIQRCRVVVVGSYHAAVFALAQGVPAVGLAHSRYYEDKFLGLAKQFGAGCEVVFLHDADLVVKLPEAIERVWSTAEGGRHTLLEAAARQIELSCSAYRKVYEIVLSCTRRGRESW
jgi:polysaccharide pyruvyl transferase WcaK-like protein